MQPLKLSLVFLIFHQWCFFSLCAISLSDLLSKAPKKLLLYSCKSTPLKTGGLCVVGACLLYGGIRYSYNQAKKEEQFDSCAQEKTYLHMAKSFSSTIKNRIKNIFVLHTDTKKSSKKSKKLATDIEKTSVKLQTKTIDIKKSIKNIDETLSSSEELNENILKQSSHVEKNSIVLNSDIQTITNKKITRHKNACQIVDFYNDQMITTLPPMDQELTAILQTCAQNTKDSKKASGAMVETNQKIINQLSTKTEDIKTVDKKEKKYTSLPHHKKSGIIV